MTGSGGRGGCERVGWLFEQRLAPHFGELADAATGAKHFFDLEQNAKVVGSVEPMTAWASVRLE